MGHPLCDLATLGRAIRRARFRALLLAFLLALGSNSDRLLAETLPNLLWIVAEDISPHLGCYGDTNAITPNLDRFAATALRYTRCWSTAPVCAPARTALITGISPSSLGAEHMRSLVKLPDFMRLYPQFLRERGYYCVNNAKEDYNVAKAGPVWDESSKQAHWKHRQPGQPFFAAVNIELSHEGQIRSRTGPLQHDPAKLRLPAYHPDTPEVRRDWARYYDNITAMDAVAGQHLEELAAAGLAEDTIVFFFGDNGSGMPRSKRWPFNSGLHVPLLIRVPEKFRHLAPPDYRRGGATGRLVAFVDFAPTLLSLAGVKPPDWMQGHAFMGPSATTPPAHVFGLRGRMDERYDLVRSVRNERFVYIRNFRPDLIYGQHIAYMFETPATRVWKQLYDDGELDPPRTFFWETKPPEELYDLRTDPDEVHNLANSSDHQPVLDELRGALRGHLLATRDVGLLPEAEMHRRSAGSTVYEFGLDATNYPFAAVLNMAWLASSLDATAIPRLKAGLRHLDSGVRHWAALGFAMRAAAAVDTAREELRVALADESPSVRVAAARALGLHGRSEDLTHALPVLGALAAPDRNGVFVSLEALSAIEALGERAGTLRDTLRTMPRSDPRAAARTEGYTGRFLDHLLEQSAAPVAQSLFNGKDLTGWTVKCKPADRDRMFWKVEDGCIVADSMDAGKHDYVWLVSDQEYSDFVLRLKFQAFRDNPGNSGVQIRSRYDDAAGWLDGPQVDIHPPGPWRTGMIWDETRGVQRWLWPDVPKGQWVKPEMAGTQLKFFFADDPPAWNDLEITARGSQIKAVLNGFEVTNYEGAGVLDDATHRDRSVGLRGHIALQIHTGDKLRIRFKDVQVQELVKSESPP